MALGGNSSVPADSLPQFVAYAKRNPIYRDLDPHKSGLAKSLNRPGGFLGVQTFYPSRWARYGPPSRAATSRRSLL
jgi:hypothetical protein